VDRIDSVITFAGFYPVVLSGAKRLTAFLIWFEVMAELTTSYNSRSSAGA
jgi:hypothetical protein